MFFYEQYVKFILKIVICIMRLILLVSLNLCLIQFSISQAEHPDLLHSLNSDKLFSYDDVQFSWKLDGKLQILLNEGINFLHEGNFEYALTNLDAFVKQDSTFWVTFYYRGICHRLLRKFRKAESDFRTAISLNNRSYESLMEMGKVYHLRLNLKEAEKKYNAAINLAPDKPLAYFMKGELEFIQGNSRAAIRNYRVCLEKNPNFSDAKTKIAIVEIIKEQNLEAGLPYLNEVLQRDSLNRIALAFRSFINQKKDKRKSLKDLNTLCRLNPENMQTLLYRGMLLIELQEYELGFVDMRRVIQANQEDENNFIGQQSDIDKRIDILNAGNYILRTIYGLDEADSKIIKKAFCLLLVSQFQNCIETLDTPSNSNNSPLCFFLKGVAYEHMGKHNDAFTHYNQALKLDNDIFDAHKKRCIYRSEIKDIKGAFDDLKEMARLQPESIVTYRLRGLIKITQNDFSGSIIDFTKFLNSDSTDAEIWKQRGIARSKVGDKKGSNDDLKKAIAIDPRINQELFEFVSQQYLEIQDTANAVDILKKYVSLAKGHPIPRLLLASIYADSKNWNQLKIQLDSIYLEIPTINVEGLIPSNFYYLQSRYSLGILDYEKAIYFANKSLQANSKNDAALYLRGQVYIKTGRQKKATKDFKVLSDLNYRDSRNIYKSLVSIGQQD